MTSNISTTIKEKATWDDTNTGIFLTILVEEIDAGHRPGGYFTKSGWSIIMNKFVSSSGCNFNVTQLKNRWDNLKKEFSLWLKLRLEETGLGYDYSTNRITADPSWWREKIQEKPEYRPFRTHGPTHLDLKEKVFGGIIVTGVHEYRPGLDPLLGNDRHIEIPNQEQGVHLDDYDHENTDDDGHINCRPYTMSPHNARKRARSRYNGTKPTVADVNTTMMALVDHLRGDSSNSVKYEDFTAADAITMLRGMEWCDVNSKYFMDAVKLFKDFETRVSFRAISDLGEEFIKKWIANERGV